MSACALTRFSLCAPSLAAARCSCCTMAAATRASSAASLAAASVLACRQRVEVHASCTAGRLVQCSHWLCLPGLLCLVHGTAAALGDCSTWQHEAGWFGVVCWQGTLQL